MLPQLLNLISEEELDFYLDSSEWIMQEKIDFERLMTAATTAAVTGSNRRGLITAVSEPIENALRFFALAGSFTADGEGSCETYFAFDLLEFRGVDFRPLGFASRLAQLNDLFSVEHPHVKVVPGYINNKREKFTELRDRGAEGVVFKRRDSPYVPGKPNSGGDQVKFKFKGSATVHCDGVNRGKRSVRISVRMPTPFDEKKMVKIGNVTIPGAQPIPSTGSYIEVEYLHCFKGGSLFQPVYKGIRGDKVEADLYDSLKFKAEGTLEDEG